MSTTIAASLAEYTEAELMDWYGATEETSWHRTIEAELERRWSAADAARPADARTEQRAEWERMARAQWLDAERVTRGELLNERGMREGIDPWTLWSGPAHRVGLYASEELRNYWLENARIDISTFQRQAAGERRAWIDRHDREAYRNESLDRHAAAGVHAATAQAAAAAAGGPVRAAGGRDEHGRGSAARGAGMAGGPVPAGAPHGNRERHVLPGLPDRVPGAGVRVPVLQGSAVNESERDRLRRRAAVLRGAVASGGAVPGDESPAPVTATGSGGGGSAGTVALRAGGPPDRGPDRAPPVDGAETLGYARQFLAHFAIWPSEAALTVATLWAAHTWARDASKALVFMSSPRLLFSSAEPGSGKSAGMKLVSRLCPDPAVFTEPSEPAVAHSIGEHATLFLDEIDVLFGTSGTRKAAIRAVINDGYTPDGYWARVRNGVTHRMSTFGALSMAGLDKVETGTSGVMAATLSRCIRIRMRKAPGDYRPPRFDHEARFVRDQITDRLGRWAAQNLGTLASYVPDLEGLGNREAELFEPLAIVADVAGGPWPGLIRDAAEELLTTGGMPEEDEDRSAEVDAILAGWAAGEGEF